MKNHWRKSTHSFHDTCVEVARPDDRLAIGAELEQRGSAFGLRMTAHADHFFT